MSSDAVTTVSVEISGSEISFETGRMAKQASGAVVVRQGDTMLLATAVAGSLRDVDFLPLTVDVEERMYASGKIPGSFFKREGRPGEKGTLALEEGPGDFAGGVQALLDIHGQGEK